MSSNYQFVSKDLELVSVARDRFSHDLFPYFLNLHGLYITLDPALIQELLHGIFERKLTHEAKVRRS